MKPMNPNNRLYIPFYFIKNLFRGCSKKIQLYENVSLTSEKIDFYFEKQSHFIDLSFTKNVK